MDRMRQDCRYIVEEAIGKVMPGEAVSRALRGRAFGPGRLLLVAVVLIRRGGMPRQERPL